MEKSMKFVNKKKYFNARWSWGPINFFDGYFEKKGLTLWGKYKRNEKKSKAEGGRVFNV